MPPVAALPQKPQPPEQREGAPRYDVLVVDAFSGDAVPLHLLTVEAVELYRQRAAADAPIVFHVSNRYLDMTPVLDGVAARLGLAAAVKHRHENLAPLEDASSYVALGPAERLRALFDLGWEPLETEEPRVFTDDRASVLPLIQL